MDRRQLLVAGAAAMALPAFARAEVPAIRTRWSLTTSEGFDALCFLGPLAGDPFYADYYGKELAAFLPKLRPETIGAIKTGFAAVRQQGGMLGPDLCLIFSGGPTGSIAEMTAALKAAETVLLPSFRKSQWWDEDAWKGFLAGREPLLAIFDDLIRADFAGFRHSLLDPLAAKRIPEMRARVAGLDTIAEQERLLGKTFPDPSIEIVMLYFSKPHGIRIQGQRFITAADYSDEIVIRIADHELMHPPFDRDSDRMKAVFAVLAADPLLTRIVKEHNPAFGYNTLEGLADEDTVQALDQIINERFGVAKPAPRRWQESDDGMHVLAAGLYGLLKADRYDRTGGNIEEWLYRAAQTGLLAPAKLHAAAAKVLKRSANLLWDSRPA
jgi:hypothetical protein